MDLYSERRTMMYKFDETDRLWLDIFPPADFVLFWRDMERGEEVEGYAKTRWEGPERPRP